MAHDAVIIETVAGRRSMVVELAPDSDYVGGCGKLEFSGLTRDAEQPSIIRGSKPQARTGTGKFSLSLSAEHRIGNHRPI